MRSNVPALSDLRFDKDCKQADKCRGQNIGFAGLGVDLEQVSHFKCPVHKVVSVSEKLSVGSEVMLCAPKLHCCFRMLERLCSHSV